MRWLFAVTAAILACAFAYAAGQGHGFAEGRFAECRDWAHGHYEGDARTQALLECGWARW